MPSKLKPGDRVSWKTPQGETRGKVIKKLASPTQIKGHTAKASKDNPEYLVESEKTHERAAHKPGALNRR
jgi:Hypervirulence associated proteins TUDOR domain